MRYRNFILFTATIVGLAIIAGCSKTPSAQPMGDAGQTIVKIFGSEADTLDGKQSGYALLTVDLIAGPQTVYAADIRRNPPSHAELNKPLTVIVKNDPGAVSAYDATLTPMPDGSFTADPATPLTGNDYTVTFAPGEFAKRIRITIKDILALDLTKSYGIGFTISSVNDVNSKIARWEKSIVFAVGVKNKLDGIYRLRGYILRAGDEPATGWVGPREFTLVTTGTNSVRMRESHGWANTATIGLLNTIAHPTYTFDEANNITITSDGGPFPDGLMNMEGYHSRYDPDTKTIYAYATWAGGPTQRQMMDTLVYLRPRE
ncbi:MAG TPA: DUF1735 domain-containing protein [Ferruginibacter sp.]|nr:DUF1735 domain-containing protein [Ferruginibacter sp.]HMP21016.1 DUF1735 domain-containing protein [Ferruginibacter sp.]